MRKINMRLVGRMWVSVPWGRNLRDIEIVTASPHRGGRGGGRGLCYLPLIIFPVLSRCPAATEALARLKYDGKVFIRSESKPWG